MVKRKWCFVLLSLVLVTSCMTGCGSRKQGLVLHFVFEDAKGISVGNKVMGDGVFVGQVIAPPESPKPKHVVVSVRIDGLSADKMAYVTTDLTAIIKKDSLVAGETFLDLIFPNDPGVPVADGTILKGRGGRGDVLDLSGISMPDDPRQFVEMIRSAFVAVDPDRAGATVFYLNCASLAVVVLTIIALLLDLLLRLPQGSERECSSPRVLRAIWMLFCTALAARFFVSIVRLLGGMGILSTDLLRALYVGSSAFGSLLLQEWPFCLLAIVLISIRFKFDLLMRARKV